MRKVSYRPYVLLALFFISLFSLNAQVSHGARALALASLSPLWQKMAIRKPVATMEAGNAREDLFLKSQMESMREWLLLEDRIACQVDRLQELSSFKMTGSELKEFFRLRGKQLISLIELSASSVLAPVVFREPASWSSYLWIGVGEKDNVLLGRRIIAKNSPVVVGNALIGVVEEVGKSRSKVRLISDAHLVPSVRVVRGEPQNRFLLEHLEALLLSLEGREDLSSFFKEQKEGLLALRGYLCKDVQATYLAKGELHGMSMPLWRSRGKKMKGVGFNYDFADSFGNGADKVSLLKKGDLLVTTGFDGVFPAGLDVAIVSSVAPLREGSSSYELEAVLASGALEEVRHVFVLPPID